MDAAMHATYGDRKQRLLADHPSEVLEIGPGAGANFRYYRPGTRIMAIEPNPRMHSLLLQRARRYGLEVEIHPAGAESLPLNDASQSCVVATLLLCSVGDPVKVLREIRRVLATGGRYIFLEHVAARHGGWVACQQWVLRRPWRWAFSGCRVDQDSLKLIEENRFDSIAYEEFVVGRNVFPFSPHIAGSAVK
jgi:ubiquinone/menaquinone biosynthesis C-methylase UbiE